ncbi:hypothetical protein [Paenibacillus monticola]|uniref:Uncharacterized protein n=1 Tax=Paenibacillus monticola TaxID=2666075 RepID=A0A7X2H3N8_9BACL|nr:hypothetical protein [Paenibacillus monticola]MRN52158.1 hypothetical protein [Paenibacillus monticola]
MHWHGWLHGIEHSSLGVGPPSLHGSFGLPAAVVCRFLQLDRYRSSSSKIPLHSFIPFPRGGTSLLG